MWRNKQRNKIQFKTSRKLTQQELEKYNLEELNQELSYQYNIEYYDVVTDIETKDFFKDIIKNKTFKEYQGKEYFDETLYYDLDGYIVEFNYDYGIYNFNIQYPHEQLTDQQKGKKSLLWLIDKMQNKDNATDDGIDDRDIESLEIILPCLEKYKITPQGICYQYADFHINQLSEESINLINDNLKVLIPTSNQITDQFQFVSIIASELDIVISEY
jgi:hypothetical protein